MNDIQSILRIAARRLETSALLGKTHVALAVAGVLVLVLLVAERVGPATFMPWSWLGPVLVAAALIAAVIAWSRHRRTNLQVAVEVDERLELREKLSTALHVSTRTDPFARAAIDDAVTTARDPRVRERVHRFFPVQGPPRWWLTPAIAAVVAAVWFVPPLDLFARDTDDIDTIAESRRESQEAIAAVINQIEENPELSAQMSDMLGELAKEKADRDAFKTREQVQRDAIKRLTNLNKRLDDILNGDKGKAADALDSTLKKLDTPQSGPAKDFAETLARGDFKAAEEALAKLMQDLKDGKLDAGQQQQLAQQLQDLAKQLQQLAQNQEALAQALQQAGLNAQLANDPNALAEAIKNNPNLNEAQKQQLQQMAQAQQQAQQMCQGLGQGMQQMAQGLMGGQMGGQAGQPGQQGQAGQQLAQQLGQLEMMQQMLQQAQAAANAAQGQCQGLGEGLGQGMGQMGQQGLGMAQAMQQWAMQQQMGGAFGQRGQGAGGRAPIAPTPTGTKIVQAPTKRSGGDIIARQFIDGPLVKGESKAGFQQVADAVAEGFDEAQGDEQIPPKYRDAHMHYFGELEKRVTVVDREEPAAAPQGDGEGDTSEDDG